MQGDTEKETKEHTRCVSSGVLCGSNGRTATASNHHVRKSDTSHSGPSGRIVNKTGQYEGERTGHTHTDPPPAIRASTILQSRCGRTVGDTDIPSLMLLIHAAQIYMITYTIHTYVFTCLYLPGQQSVGVKGTGLEAKLPGFTSRFRKSMSCVT